MVLSLSLGVAFLALWVFGSNVILKVARMIDAPVTKQVAMEVVIPVAMPVSPRETQFSTIAPTNLPSEPAVAESAVAESAVAAPVEPKSVVWEPFAPKPVEASTAAEQSVSLDQSTSLPAPVAAQPATSERTTPTPSRSVVAKGQATSSPSESFETVPSPASVGTAPAASEPLVPKPVKTTIAEGQTTRPSTAPVVFASAEASIESRWPGRLIARAVEPVADERSDQSSVPLPPARPHVVSVRPHVVSVPLPAPRPAIGTQHRPVAGRVLTEADVRIQELHF